MDSKKEKLLKKTFDDYIELMLYDFPVERIGDLIAEDVSGFGTTVDEKILEIKRFKKVVTDQREQGAGLEMYMNMMAVTRRISPDEDTAIFMDEFEISMVVDGEKNVIPLRLTSIFEFNDNTWKLVHLHGSKAVETEGDTWHLNEWKKKNEELQKQVEEKTTELLIKNRELEIEAALERVRTAAMSMQKPDDLLDICDIISGQLETLNVKNIRNVQVAIVDEPKKNYLNYQYFTAYSQRVFEVTDYENHPASQAMVDEMQKSVNSFFTGKMEGEALDGFRKWRKQYDQFPDPLLDKSEAVYYYFYSIGKGGLGLTTYEEISTESLEIFKRFHKVFALAYRRFIDIQQAMEQAREAQIESALERARAQSMMMQHSEELNKTAQVFHEQLRMLGIDSEFSYLWLPDELKKEHLFWATWQEGDDGSESFKNKRVIYPLDKSEPAIAECYVAWESGLPVHVNLVPVNGVEAYFNTWSELLEGVDKFKPEGYPDGLYYVDAYMKYGCFGIMIRKLLTEEEQRVLNRFSLEFERTYTRFLDLQKAETQAKEAQIETALERVRSRSMGMQKSKELKEVIQVVYEQFVHLGIFIEHTGFIMDYKERDEMLIWLADKNGVPSQVTIPYFDSPHWNSFVEAKKKGDDFFTNHLDFVTKNKFYKKLFAFIPGLPEESKKHYLGCPGLAISTVLLDNVGLYIENFSGTPYSDEENKILMRFGNVFQQSYTRFLDLQKAEAQAREALVELSLERIRAQVTSMRESDELLDIVVMMQAEFTKLGHEAHYFWHMRWLADKYEKALTNGEGTRIGNVLELPRGFHGLKNMMDWEQSDEPTAVFALEPDIAADYIDKMIKLGRFQEIDHSAPGPDEVRDMGGLTFVMARTTHGEIGYSLPGVVPDPPDVDIATLARFAGVFDLAYRRFEDLKSAERQAREAVKQSSLDRVRGQIASMRSPEDLQRITPLIWNELKVLEVPFFRCGVFIVDDKNKHVQVYLTTPEGNSLGLLDLDFEMSDLTRDTVRSWRQKEVYQTHWNKEEFIAWTREMMKLQQVDTPEQYQGAEAPPESLHLHFIPFAQGMLYVGHEDQLEKDKIDLVKSLAEAFSFAYARYQDFIILEEAKERVEKALGDLKSTQSQLIQSEKMASLGELTAGIAHEIQNPLNFVNNFSEVSIELIDELKQESSVVSHQSSVVSHQSAMEIIDDIRQNLEKILHHGKRADAIVKGMLQHSRSSSGVKEPTDINALADEYLRLAFHGLRAKDKSFNATMKTDFDETIGMINIIPQDIGRVILNLITNAFYAVNEKKTELAEKNYEPTVSVTTKKTGNNVLISVKDNGDGIPQKIIDKIFQPFFTTKPAGQGTGLGLSLSYDIVKAHGGELKVETKEGAGTQFIIVLSI